MRTLIFILAFIASVGEAFIPPIPLAIREIFDGRKPGALEIVLRHRIGGGEFEERIVCERGRYQMVWRGGLFQQPVAATWERQAYFIGDRNISSRSGIFLKYFGSHSADEFKDALMAEKFMRRDQMIQFKPGFSPSGDPQTWDLRENYLKHPDIFLERVRGSVAIVVVGLDEGALRKAVAFDRSLKGVRRIEWKDGQEVAGWTFENFSKFPSGGTYPHKLSFDINGNEVISSDVVAVRTIGDRALADFRTGWKQAASTTGLSPNAEAALQRLLGFR